MKKQDSLLSKDIARAVDVIKKGGIVIFPTDTVYGVGCRYDDTKAVEKIFKIKKRPKDLPLPVLVSRISQVKKIAKLNKTAESLIKAHWPGGLTIVLNAKDGQGKIGLRQADHATPIAIIEKAQTPIIGTSANFHDKKTPTSTEELDPDFVKLVDLVISGKCKNMQESTVVDATINPPKILRQGAVKLI